MRILKASDPKDHRMWIYWGDKGSNIGLELGKIPSWDLGFHLNFGTENITLGLYLFLFDFYITLDSQRIHRWLNKHPNHFFKKTWEEGSPEGSYWEERAIGLKFYFRQFIFTGEWWTNMNNEPRNRYFYWVIPDKIFGRNKYTEKVLKEGDIEIDMPEGVYKATYKRFMSFWKKPRLPFIQKMERITIEIPVGIPHEGKGENSWDCGMDATFASTFPVERGESIYAIAKRFAMSCLKTRQKYGSLHSPEYAKWKLQGEIKQEHGENAGTGEAGDTLIIKAEGVDINGKTKN